MDKGETDTVRLGTDERGVKSLEYLKPLKNPKRSKDGSEWHFRKIIGRPQYVLIYEGVPYRLAGVNLAQAKKKALRIAKELDVAIIIAKEVGVISI